jgi:hypothetical protein
MTKPEKLGIWMDHQSANLMEFTTDPIQTKTIHSKFTHQVKELTMHEGENRMHHKEQHEQAEYYKELGDIIRGYKAVVLFGPTEAKTELHNLLLKNNLFSKIHIDVRTADKMTENQQHAFVKDFFSKNPNNVTTLFF